MEELDEYIEPGRKTVLLKMILFNNYYAEYLLTFEKFKDKISFSKNHLFWSKDNTLIESKNIGIYGFNNNEDWGDLLKDEYLKPLFISYLSIKAVMHNDKKIFEKWEMSFESLSGELSNSIKNLSSISEEQREKLNKMIDDLNSNL
jgi:hypothetical protein